MGRRRVPLNGVGPGIVLTPMTAPLMQTEQGRAQRADVVPMPLHGPFEPVVVARALAWLSSGENTHTTGQVLLVDGGADVALRGPRVFGPTARRSRCAAVVDVVGLTYGESGHLLDQRPRSPRRCSTGSSP